MTTTSTMSDAAELAIYGPNAGRDTVPPPPTPPAPPAPTPGPHSLPRDWMHEHWRDAATFIHALTGSSEGRVCWQTFVDDKATKEAHTLHGPFSRRLPELLDLHQRGAGVFVAVNDVPDGQRRNKGNIPVARAWWADVDLKDWPAEKRDAYNLPEFIASLPLPPSIVVETKGGAHLYWLARDEIAPEECEALNKRIAVAIGGDTQAAEWSRVLRVPGFYHLKDRDDPFLVRLERCAPAMRYTLADMEAAFPATELPLAPPAQPPSQRTTVSTTTATADAGAAYDDIDVTVAERKVRAHKWLKKRAPAVDGEHGSTWAFETCMVVARGFAVSDDADALEVLRGWNSTCRPPWSYKDDGPDSLPKKVRDARREGTMAIGCKLARHDAEQTEETDAAAPQQATEHGVQEPPDAAGREDDTPVPPPMREGGGIPLPNGDDKWFAIEAPALHGAVGDYVRRVEPHSEADPAAILLQLLAVFGNMVGRRPHFIIEGRRHYLNLNVAVVGKTSRARKGTSYGRVMELARLVDEAWTENNIMEGGLASGQGLIFRVRDPIPAIGKQPADPGVTDKRLLVVEEELSKIFRVRRQDSSTLMEVLRSAWDGSNLCNTTRRDPVKATHPHISIIGHTTRHELLNVVERVDLVNGVANRFLWVAAERTKKLPRGGTDFSPNGQPFRDAAEHAQCVGCMDMTPAAWARWDTEYEYLERDRHGMLDPVTGRAPAQVRRLACIYALLDGSSDVDVPHLAAALAVWAYCENTARLLFEDRPSNPTANRILTMLRQAGASGMRRGDINKRLSGHVEAGELEQALADLERRSLAKRSLVKSTGGRPAEVWLPVML